MYFGPKCNGDLSHIKHVLTANRTLHIAGIGEEKRTLFSATFVTVFLTFVM